jgi:hypothetical protein
LAVGHVCVGVGVVKVAVRWEHSLYGRYLSVNDWRVH